MLVSNPSRTYLECYSRREHILTILQAAKAQIEERDNLEGRGILVDGSHLADDLNIKLLSCCIFFGAVIFGVKPGHGLFFDMLGENVDMLMINGLEIPSNEYWGMTNHCIENAGNEKAGKDMLTANLYIVFSGDKFEQ